MSERNLGAQRDFGGQTFPNLIARGIREMNPIHQLIREPNMAFALDDWRCIRILRGPKQIVRFPSSDFHIYMLIFLRVL